VALTGVITPFVVPMFQEFRKVSCSSKLWGVNDALSDKELRFEILTEKS
jgi:hypothetical protein